MSCKKPLSPRNGKQQRIESRLCMTGSVDSSIRKPGADQVALTSGPLVLSHCRDSPRHREPVEMISSGPVSAEGCLAHCQLRIASRGKSAAGSISGRSILCGHCAGATLMQYGFDQINIALFCLI